MDASVEDRTVHESVSVIRAHAMTYHRFTLGLKTTAMVLGLAAAFLTLWFATPTGFVGSAVIAIVLAAIGVYAMTHGLARSSEPHPTDSDRT